MSRPDEVDVKFRKLAIQAIQDYGRYLLFFLKTMTESDNYIHAVSVIHEDVINIDYHVM